MSNEGGILWLLNKFTKGVLLLAALVIVVALFIPLFQKSQRLREERYDLERQIKTIEAENKRLEEEAAALSRDPKAIERVARERLGWARPEERVYRFETPKPSAPTTNRPATPR